MKVAELCPTLCNPLGLLQADSLPAEPQRKPKNTGEGSLSLLQWIFLTRESNQGLLHCRWILYQLSYQGRLCSPPCLISVLCKPQRLSDSKMSLSGKNLEKFHHYQEYVKKKKGANITNYQGNANQNHHEISSHTYWNDLSKITNNKCWQ